MRELTYDSQTQRRILGAIPDLIRGRELLFDLVWKDLRARYRYAAMGFLWAVFEPLAMMLVLTFVFAVLFPGGKAGEGAASGRSFAAMLLCGLIFWQYTANALTNATYSIVQNQNLVNKVHFCRETIPLASAIFPMVNLAIGFGLLLVVQVILGGRPSVSLLAVPCIFAVQFALTAGFGLLFSAAHVHFRDVGNMINVGVMFGFYASPVFYPVAFVSRAVENHIVPGWMGALYYANPMAGLLTAYRQAILDGVWPSLGLLIWPAIMAAIGVIAGVTLFRRAAPNFSDHL